jgi:Na+/proline symporter
VDGFSKVTWWMDVFSELVGPPVGVLLLVMGIQTYRDGGSVGWPIGGSVLLLISLYVVGRRFARYAKRRRSAAAATPTPADRARVA